MQKYKINRELVTCVCDNCGREYLKPKSEYLRNVKLGRHNFCSRNCVGTFSNINRPTLSPAQIACRENIVAYASNKRDEYSPFRESLRRLRGRFKEVSITLQDLKELWEAQNGRCAYTNLPLVLPTSKKHPDLRYQASVDRIDSSKGYIKGNIQFVAAPINLMKSTMTDEVFKDYLKEIISSISFK